MNKVRRLSSSFRDPSGFVFQENGKILRQVNESWRDSFELLMNSGLYQKLVDNQFLIPHEKIENVSFPDSNGFCVIKPEQIAYTSYPYEWCFSQLKDAAILTLAVQRIALKHGMSLKDASAYNIQFRGSQPVFIDTLSFERFEKKPWVAYKQFCQHFVAPLALASYCDYRLTELLKSYIDGIPLDLTARLLPTRTKFKLGLLMHIHLHARSQKKYADKGQDRKVQDKVTSTSMTAARSTAIVDQLTSTVNALKWSMIDSEWGDYYQDTNYRGKSLDEKSSIISEYILKTGIDKPSIQDLGANDGKFGREVSNLASIVVCHDIDETAVEKNYLAGKADNDRKILPLVQNLVNPSPATGWANAERDNFADRGPLDVSMALALIHHLAISNNLPLDWIAAYFSRLSRYLVIEFVPKQDSQVQRLLSTRRDIFPDYTQEGFESAFAKSFELILVNPVPGTERTLFLMKSLTVG
jgi:hypothetical protein